MRKSYRRGVAAFPALALRHSRDKDTVLRLEALEDRALMTATVTSDVETLGVTSNTPYGLTPAQVREAYGFNQVSFGKVAANGAGQTIAIVDAYGDPNIAADLAKFDSTFGIAAPPSFKIENQNGGTSGLPASNASWDLEISLDVEWAHAIAPGANIVLVEANSSNLSDLLAGVNTARNTAGVSVVSMSWGTSDFNGENLFDSYFTTPAGHTGITFVASSGDSGSPSGWPALSSNVLAVGGTTLTLGSGSNYKSETAWGDSGGSTSLYESEPSYQKLVQSTGKRTGPDVSYDANPNTGFAVYDSIADNRQSGWFEVGGTSAGAPQWSALIAVADQGRATVGLGSINGAQAAIYSLPASDFHDITSGSNGGYAAKAGYDEVTGRGSPIANLVIEGLIGSVTAGNTAAGYAITTKTTVSGNVETGGDDNGFGGAGIGGDGFSVFGVSAVSVGQMQSAQQIVNASAAAIAQIGAGGLALDLHLAGDHSALDTGTPASGSGWDAHLAPIASIGPISQSVAEGLPGGKQQIDTRPAGLEASGSRGDSVDASRSEHGAIDRSESTTGRHSEGDRPSSAIDVHSGALSLPADAAIDSRPDSAALEAAWSELDFEIDATDWNIAAPNVKNATTTEPSGHVLAGLALAGLTFGFVAEPASEATPRRKQTSTKSIVA